jgi:hypothetical protein
MTPVRDAVIGEATHGAVDLFRPRTFNPIEPTDESGDDQQVA